MASYDKLVLQKIIQMHTAFDELYGMIDKKHLIDISPAYNALTKHWNQIHNTREPEEQVAEISRVRKPENIFKARQELLLWFYIPLRRALIDCIHIINGQNVDPAKLEKLSWINGLVNSDIEVIDALPVDENPKFNLPGLVRKAINTDGPRNSRYSGKWDRRSIPELNVPKKEEVKTPKPTPVPKTPKPQKTRQKRAPKKATKSADTPPTGAAPATSGGTATEATSSEFRTSTATGGGGSGWIPPDVPPSSSTGPSRGPSARRPPPGSGPATPGGAALQKLLKDMEGRLGAKIDRVEANLSKAIKLNTKKLDSLKRDFDPGRLRRPGMGDRSDSSKLDSILEMETEIIKYSKKTSQTLAGKDDGKEEAAVSPAGKRRQAKENHMGFWKTIKEQALKDVGHFGRDVHNVLFPYLKMQESGLASLLGKPHKDDKKDEDDKTKRIIENTIEEWEVKNEKKHKKCDCNGNETGSGRRKRRKKTGSRMPTTVDGEVINSRPINRRQRISHDIEANQLEGHSIVGQKLLTYDKDASRTLEKRVEREGEEQHEKFGELEREKSLKERLDDIWKDVEEELKETRQNKMQTMLGRIWDGLKNGWKFLSGLVVGGFKQLWKLTKFISRPVVWIARNLAKLLGAADTAGEIAGGIGVAVGAAVDAGMAWMMNTDLKNQANNQFDSFNKKNGDHVKQVGANAYQIVDDDKYKGKTFKMNELPNEYQNAINFGAPFPTEPKSKANSSEPTETVTVSAKPSSLTGALKSVTQVQQTLKEEQQAESGTPVVQGVVMPPPQTNRQGPVPDIGIGLDVNTTDTNETMQRHLGILMNRTPGAANFR